jgi:hypothetical protein
MAAAPAGTTLNIFGKDAPGVDTNIYRSGFRATASHFVRLYMSDFCWQTKLAAVSWNNEAPCTSSNKDTIQRPVGVIVSLLVARILDQLLVNVWYNLGPIS